MAISRRVNKEDVMHIYSAILLSQKKNAICSNTDGPRDYQTISQRQISYHLHEKPKKIIQMNSFTNQKQTHRLRKQTYGYQRGKGADDRDKRGDWH